MTIKPTSPWLSALPPRRVEGRRARAWRLLRRGLLLTILVAPLAGAAYIIWLRALPADGAGRTLYLLHDNLYLPAKGWLLLRFWPWSLIVWSFVAVLIALLALFWLLDRSTTKRPQIALLRMVLARPGSYGLLIGSLDLLRWLGATGEMIAIVADHEWDAAWARIVRRAKPTAHDCQRLANLTRFKLLLARRATSVASASSRASTAATQLAALEFWLQAWVSVLAVERHDLGRLRGPLKSLLASAPLAHLDQLEQLPAGAAMAAFDPGVLAREVRSALNWVGASLSDKPTPTRQATAETLSAAVERRRQLASHATAALERLLTSAGTPGPGDQPPFPTVAPDTLAAAGRLARLLSVQAAVVADVPALATGYESALAGLRLTLTAVHPPLPEASPRWRELLDGSPEARLWPTLFWDWAGPKLLAAQLQAAHHEQARRDWARLYQLDSWLVDPEAGKLAAANLAAAELAAGPIAAAGDWRAGARRRDERSQRQFETRTARLALRRRVDLALAAVVVLGLLIMGSLATVGVGVANRSGVFDPPLLQPLADERILTNVRADLAAHPLLDAAFHSDQHFYISQAGGIVHRYQPLTQLWSSERPFAPEEPISDRFVLLRSGCGDEADALACSDPTSLWALGDDGSLARRVGGHWQLVVSNSAFIGASGAPVEHDQVTAAAVSDDQSWLLLGTEADGFGLFDTRQRRWHTGAAAASAALSPIEHAVWWRGYFWLAGEDGLARVSMDRRSNAITVEPLAQFTNPLLDLDADPEGALWILDERPCRDSGSSCLWLGTLRTPDAEPKVVVDQQNEFSDLSLADLQYAQQVDDTLTLAGQAGVFAYNLELHAWEQLFAGDVTAVLPLDDGFYFAGTRLLGLTRAGAIEQTWPLPDEQVVQIVAADSGELLLFSAVGSLYRLAPRARDIEMVRAAAGVAIDPAGFQMAASFGDVVMLLGPDGGLLHNTRTRTYEELALDAVPAWLTDPAARVVVNGAETFVVPAAGETTVHVLETARMGDSSYFTGGWIDQVPTPSVAIPISSAWPLNGPGLGLLDAEGSVHVVDATVATFWAVDPALPQLANGALQDVVAHSANLVFLVGGELWEYDLKARTWRSLPSPAAAGEAVVALASADGQALAITDRNRLLTLGGTALVGDLDGFAISSGGVSDAWPASDGLYLAGEGRIVRYDSDARQVAADWVPLANGKVEIRALVQGVPLAQVGDRAVFGDQVLDEEAGPVLATSFDGTRIWTVRSAGGRSYLKGYTPTGGLVDDPVCFFRTPSGGATTSITDGRALPNGTIVLATDAGQKLYDPRARSWFEGDAELDAASRIYALGSHLLFVRGAEASGDLELAIIVASALRVPDSCSSEPANVAQTVVWFPVRGYAVDESASAIAWIEPEGSVVEWRAGTETTILEPPGTAPDSSALQHMFDFNDRGYLFFSTGAELYRYALGSRHWTLVELAGLGSPWQAIDVVRTSNRGIITAVGADGGHYVGELTMSSSAVTLLPRFRPTSERFGLGPDAVLDVQERNGAGAVWTFVTPDRIKYLNAANRSWSESMLFDRGDQKTFLDADGRGVLLDNAQRAWWIATEAGPTPTAFVRYDLDASDKAVALDRTGLVWRLTQLNEVLRCSPNGDRYRCQEHLRPFLLDSTSVRHAWHWGDYDIFETDQGLRAYFPAGAAEVELSEATADFAGVAAAFRLRDRLVLISQDRTVLTLTSDLATQRWDQVEDALLDSGGALWIRQEGAWRLVSRDAPLRLADGADPQTAGVTVFFLPGGEPAGVNPAGQSYRWQDGALTPSVQLPAEIVSQTIRHLAPVDDALWVVLPAEVRRLQEGPCAQTGQTGTDQPEQTCLQVTGSVAVDPAPLRQAIITPDGLQLVGDNGLSTSVTVAADGSLSTAVQQDPAALPGLPLDDEWNALRASLVPRTDGVEVYDPVSSLRAGERLEAVTASGGAIRLAGAALLPASADMPFTLPRPLNVGWLRWNRGPGTFSLATPSGQQDLPRDRIVVDQRLVFEDVAAVIATTLDGYTAANSYGIWEFSGGTGYEAITSGQLQPLAQPISSAQGVFLSDGNIYPTSGAPPNIANPYVRTVGAVRFVEDLAASQLTATLSVSGRQLDAYPTAGFLWDRNRRALAYDGANLLLQSDAGIDRIAVSAGPSAALTPLADFDAGPASLALQGARLRDDGAGQALLFDPAGATWYELARGAWRQRAVDPLANRPLVSSQVWYWNMASGQVDVVLAGNPRAFAWSPSNLTFNFDALRAAAAHDGQLLIATDAWLEVAANATQVGALGAGRLAPITTDRLVALHENQTVDLYSYQGPSVLKWNPTALQFGSPLTTDPEVDRELAMLPRLRINLQAGAPLMELQVDDVASGTRWLPFTLDDGRFPFDVVAGVEEFDGEVYLATRAGLSAFPPGSFAWPNQRALLHLSPAAALAPVDQIGRPSADPDLLVAVTGADCYARRASQVFAPCSDATPRSPLLQLSDSFWEWELPASGGLAGRYRVAGGALAGDPIDLAGGRLPHDRLQAVSACAGLTLSLWDANWVTVQRGDALTIDANAVSFHLADNSLRDFYCASQEIALDATTVPAGSYLRDWQDAVWLFDGSQWRPAASATAAGVIEVIAHPHAYYAPRLRLRTPADGQPWRFDQRRVAGDWRALAWSEDPTGGLWRVSVDDWQRIGEIDGVLWAATAAGLSPQTRAGADLTLPPETLHIIREPTQARDPCQVTDLLTAASTMTVRCADNSARVYAGAPNRRLDAGVFQRSDLDPFASGELIAAGGVPDWAWSFTGRSDGERGHLQATWRGEPLTLDGGQFAFDTLTSLALFTPDRLELATSTGGWYQAERDAVSVAAIARPEGALDTPSDFVQLGYEGAKIRLCLRSRDDPDSWLMLGGENPLANLSDCPAYLGRDSQWLYGYGKLGLRAPALESLGGVGERALEHGRFTDDIVIGPPVPGRIGNDAGYWLPTAAGVVRLDSSLERGSFYPPPFPGLDGDAAPAALAVVNDGSPAYVGGSDLYLLDIRQTTDTGVAPPVTGMLRELFLSRDGFWISSWPSADGGIQRSVVVNGAPLINTWLVDATLLRSYQSHQVDWRLAPGLVTATLDGPAITLEYPGRDPVSAVVPEGLVPQAGEVVGSRLLLIGEQHLLDINMDKALNPAPSTAQ